MAAVFQEVTIGWGGEEYRITPTMRLLNKIEQDVSLSALAYRISMGDVPVSLLAKAVSVMLREAGASNAGDEAVYMELLNGDPDSVRQMAEAVILAAFPQEQASKKSEAPASKAKGKK